jgi:hypothetical protein
MSKVNTYRQGISKLGICTTCGMNDNEQQSKGCCKDEQKYLKNNIDQKANENRFDGFQTSVLCLPGPVIEIPLVYSYDSTQELLISNSPPKSKSVALYLRYCDFRI